MCYITGTACSHREGAWEKVTEPLLAGVADGGGEFPAGYDRYKSGLYKFQLQNFMKNGDLQNLFFLTEHLSVVFNLVYYRACVIGLIWNKNNLCMKKIENDTNPIFVQCKLRIPVTIYRSSWQKNRCIFNQEIYDDFKFKKTLWLRCFFYKLILRFKG